MNIKLSYILFIITAGYNYASYNPVMASEPVKLYVSLHGSELSNGTKDNPFATLEAAKDAIRQIKEREGGLKAPVEVIIKGGTYYLEETFVLQAEDSGTEDAPITWCAADNESVVISGGKQIEGKWRKNPDTNIWKLNIPQTKGWKRNVNASEYYEQKPAGPWHFRQLFVNGKRATRSRYPNVDDQNPFMYAEGGSMEHVELKIGLVKSNWGDEPDAQLNMIPNWRFFNQWNDVIKVDENSSSIYFGPREQHGKVIKGNWFWIEGVKSELDQPGEWYLDPEEGFLYYMAAQGQDPNKLKFIAPKLNRLIYLRGDVEKGTHVKHVGFKGIEFRHTTFTLGHIEARVHTDGAVMFENARHCRVENCFFENIGGYALWLHLDSRENVFHRNTVLNSGGGGVLLTGARLSYMDDSKIYAPGEAAAKVAPYWTSITHNTVKHCGQIRYYGGGVHIDSRPASMAMLPGNYIAHNHFQDLSRNGIFTFRNQGGKVVEFNEIHDCMKTTIDGACIHLASMNRFNAPNFIMNNYLYDIWGYEQMPDGKPHRTLANGIFLDWATSNTTIKNNVIYNSGGREIKTIMGNWNLDIENNHSSKTRIETLNPKEIGPKGTASHSIETQQLINTGGVIKSSDKELVHYSGFWKETQVTGFWGLFEYNYIHAPKGKAAYCEFRLPIADSGLYKICLMYYPEEANASNAKITIKHAEGEKILDWNFREGDQHGFAVRVGEYKFDQDKPAFVAISNEHADGFIVADAVGFIKVDQ